MNKEIQIKTLILFRGKQIGKVFNDNISLGSSGFRPWTLI